MLEREKIALLILLVAFYSWTEVSKFKVCASRPLCRKMNFWSMMDIQEEFTLVKQDCDVACTYNIYVA